MMRRGAIKEAVDKTGRTQGHLVVLGKAHSVDVFTRGRLKHRLQFWRCACSCGADKCRKEVVTSLRGTTSSCGARRYKPTGEAELRRAMGSYIYACRKFSRRHPGTPREFRLTYEQYKAIVLRPCRYCGALPLAGVVTARTKRCNGRIPHHGLDRVDNAGSYTLDNCVSCCRTCNIMKQDLSSDDFLAHATKIVRYREAK